MKGATIVSLAVVFLIGLALGSAVAYQIKPRATVNQTVTATTGVGNSVTYQTATVTDQPLLYYHVVPACEIVSGIVTIAYITAPLATTGETTVYPASLSTVYIVTVTTAEGAQEVFVTQTFMGTCF